MSWIDKQPPFETDGRDEIVEAVEQLATCANHIEDLRGWIIGKLRTAKLQETSDDGRAREFVCAARAAIETDLTPIKSAMFRVVESIGPCRLGNDAAIQAGAATIWARGMLESVYDQFLPKILTDSAVKEVQVAGRVSWYGNELHAELIDKLTINKVVTSNGVYSFRSCVDALLLMAEVAWRRRVP